MGLLARQCMLVLFKFSAEEMNIYFWEKEQTNKISRNKYEDLDFYSASIYFSYILVDVWINHLPVSLSHQCQSIKIFLNVNT